MALTTRDGLVAAIAGGKQVKVYKNSITAVAGIPQSLFRQGAGSPGVSTLAVPTTVGRVLTNADSGALPLPVPSGGGTCYLGQALVTMALSGVLMLGDRLVEFGGLSGIVTTAQPLSAVALPARAGTGVGVELWLEWYVATGSTASAVVTASYTNSDGTPGRTATLVGGIPVSVTAYRMYQMSLQAGDVGVRSVESVTLGTNTLTAGSFGVTLIEPICMFGTGIANVLNVMGYAETGLPKIDPAGCLAFQAFTTTTSTGNFTAALNIISG